MNLHRTTITAALVFVASLAATAQANPAAQPAAAAKGVVQARTQAEYDAYQVIKTKPQTPEEFEKAADEFATRFPDSNLRIVLYRGVMQSYQQAENDDKMMAAGLKVLALDKDDPEALIVVAEVQEEHTSPMDLDREQRMDEVVANAQHGLQTIDTDLTVPAGTAPERVEAYKKFLRSTALSLIGKIQYKRQQYAEAETTLRKALDIDGSSPNPVVLLSLALSLDMEKKYADALQQVNRAVELTKEDSDVGEAARDERDRLVNETQGDGASQKAAPGTQPASPPSGN